MMRSALEVIPVHFVTFTDFMPMLVLSPSLLSAKGSFHPCERSASGQLDATHTTRREEELVKLFFLSVFPPAIFFSSYWS